MLNNQVLTGLFEINDSFSQTIVTTKALFRSNLRTISDLITYRVRKKRRYNSGR